MAGGAYFSLTPGQLITNVAYSVTPNGTDEVATDGVNNGVLIDILPLKF